MNLNMLHMILNQEQNTSYSNSGYVLLGYIIEKISNKSYEEYVKENVFDKLSMIDTGYDDYYKVIKKRASGYEVKRRRKKNDKL